MKPALWSAAVLSALSALAACAAATGPIAQLENTYWKLREAAGVAIEVAEGQREPHVVLHPARAGLAGHTGCARLDGHYTLDGGHLTLRAADLSTPAPNSPPCANVAAARQQALMLDALARCARWRIEGERLVLSDARGVVVARLESVYLR